MKWERYHTIWAIMIFGWITNYVRNPWIAYSREVDGIKSLQDLQAISWP